MLKQVMVFITALLFVLFGPRAIYAQLKSVEVPAGSSQDLFVNLWFELYEGSSRPSFEPVPHLMPNTNYRFVMDISAIAYGDSISHPAGVLSLPMREVEPGQILQVVVVTDEMYNATERPHFFLHKYRADFVSSPDMRGQLNQFDLIEKIDVVSNPFTLLQLNDKPVWVIERHVFKIGVKDRLGEAPLAIVFRAPDVEREVAQVISTRFCVALDPNQCGGFPRRSEYLEYEIEGNPPPLPSQKEFRGWIPLQSGGEQDGRTPTWTWNSWTYRTGDPNRTPLAALLLEENGVETEYTLQVDASLYIYEKILQGLPIGHAPPDPTLSEMVNVLMRQGITTREFTVRTEVIGHAVEIANQQTHHIVLDLTKLDPSTPQPNLMGARNPVQLSAIAAATTIEISLDPRAVGCGAIAISITDKSGVRPLDHLVHSLEVISSPDSQKKCSSNEITTVLTAGLHNLLTHGDAPLVDAALHVFEQFSLDSGKVAAAFLYGVSDAPFSWEIYPPLTEYLADKRNLEGRIEKARELTINGTKHAYGRVGTTLANALFSAKDPAEQKKARAAKVALKAFVDGSATPPSFLVRFTDRRGDIVFLPFSLLSAPGSGGFLRKPLQVILPLPKEDYGESGCLNKWSVAISDKLDGAVVKLPDEIKQQKNWLGESFEKLRDYLTNQDQKAQQEGLVVVSHHNAGRLYYNKNDYELQVNELTREYGEATAALLVMCESAGVNRVDRLLYEKLNSFGLDAAILSPFSLDANYGKAFAIEFTRLVNKALAQGKDYALLNLFNQAISATATAMKNHTDLKVKGSVGDMGLELIFVGNPNLRLCASP
ncbi:MAG: hypothetical protein NPIRA02_17810 [Nitrospirales bacterium]|nr:MAG: hypothetical protein NPIRA02_17810 [Nitrospirales bacterium]